MVQLSNNRAFKEFDSSDRVCILCGKTAKNKIMKHRNEGLENFEFHSDCVKDKYMSDDSPIDVLRLMNIPYVNSLWVQINESVEGDPELSFSKYMRAIGPRRQYKEFIDSDFGETGESEYIITDEMKAKWGPDHTIDDYKAYESAYKSFAELKTPNVQLDEDQYIAAVLLQRRAKNAYLDLDMAPNHIKSIQEAYENSLKAIGLDSKSINDKNSDKWLGEMIRDHEEHAPLPTMAPEFHDVDGIERVFTRWFLYPLLDNLGKADSKMKALMNDYRRDYIPGYADMENEEDE